MLGSTQLTSCCYPCSLPSPILLPFEEGESSLFAAPVSLVCGLGKVELGNGDDVADYPDWSSGVALRKTRS